MIGEDERGQTVLSPAREDALLRITSEHGCLTLQAMAMDWTFSEEGGLSRQHLTFVEGLTLKLSFPGSSLILTPDFEARARAGFDREIRLLPTKSPVLTLTRVNEPVSLIEPALLPAPDAANAEVLEADLHIEEATDQARAADALTRWDHQVPDEMPDREPQPAVAVQASPSSAVAEPEGTPVAEGPTGTFNVLPAREAPSSRKRHRPLAGLIAAVALLTPMYLFLVDGGKLGVDFPLTNYRPLNESPLTTGTIERSSPAPAAIEHAAPTELEPAADAVPEPLPQQVPAVNEQQLLIASLLAEAKAFYDAGQIVSPVHANTVSHLTQVLSMDPANEEGLKLMYRSALTLIEEAQAAHDAGDSFLARNLVEDVLGFHPEFDDARALLDSWTRTPEG